MKRRSTRKNVVLVLAALVLCSSAVFSQGLVTGIRISNVSSIGPDATFDVTLNTNSPSDSYAYTGFLGQRFTVYSAFSSTYTSPTTVSTGTGTTSGFTRRVRGLIAPVVNAIEFGDGDVITATTIPAVTPGTPGVYVGSFSHTYPGSGTFTIRAATTQPVDSDAITTGTEIFALPGSTVNKSFSSSSSQYTHTPSSSTFSSSFSTAYSTSYTSSAKSILVGLFNTAEITTNLREVPVLSGWSMTLLIAGLLGGGFFLLRRR